MVTGRDRESSTRKFAEPPMYSEDFIGVLFSELCIHVGNRVVKYTLM